MPRKGIRGLYAFSVVAGYTHVEESLFDNTRAFFGLDFGVVKPDKKEIKVFVLLKYNGIKISGV